jgi:ABC-2 type transport system permease protein
VTLTNVFTKSARDRFTSTLVGAVAIAGLLLMGMAVYRGVDLSFYADLPKAFRDMFGISDNFDVGGLAYGAVYSGYGVLTMAAIALAAGAGAIAGEERNGTMGILLGNPVSRTGVAVSKMLALVFITAIGFLVLWGTALVAPHLFNVSTTGLHLTPLLVLMFVNTLLYGFLAFALSAWTGKNSLASGVTAAIMIVSFVAVGLLPLVESLSWLQRFFPWYYYQHGDVLNAGMDWGGLAVLVAGIVLCAVAAVVGINRRDLRTAAIGTKLIDRLRSNPLTHTMAERLAGKARVSRIWVKTASDHQSLLYIIVPIIFLMCLMIGPMYGLLDNAIKSLGDQFPEAMLALFGGGDLSTPEGFYRIEMFGLMIPAGVIVATVAIATGAMAGEEKRNTMGLLLANPIRRSYLVLEKASVMVLYAAIVGAGAFFGTAAGSLLGGLGMNMGHIAATSLLAMLVGLSFGGLALAIGGATGSSQLTAYGTVGVAVVTFIMNGLLPLNPSTEAWARISPFHYYLGNDPLLNGMAWAHAALLAGLAVLLTALGVVLFERRDLRARG